jgi:hypothetical protein
VITPEQLADLPIRDNGDYLSTPECHKISSWLNYRFGDAKIDDNEFGEDGVSERAVILELCIDGLLDNGALTLTEIDCILAVIRGEV